MINTNLNRSSIKYTERQKETDMFKRIEVMRKCLRLKNFKFDVRLLEIWDERQRNHQDRASS